MLNLYRSDTGDLAPLLDPGRPSDEPIRIYVCGITPYDTTHLGHAFTYTSADILIRYLEHRGHEVVYVQNVTDIDDDILKKAGETGDSWQEIGDRWTAHFIEDMIALNVRPPEHYPRATEVIPEIIDTVARLIDAGVAYESGGGVYFEVDRYSAFGELSGLDREAMLATANERGNIPDDPNKRDPLDFVLWQAHAPGEPSWDSPWGPGRPGWHIECSTMASKYLGETIDIHSGGADLLFPHHCCEIAQIEPLTGERFSRFWMHAAMVRHEGDKMSKSLGNLVWARDLLEEYPPDALRLYLAAHHYQIEWAHDPGALDWAAGVAARFRRAAEAPGGDGAELPTDAYVADFNAAMDDNLDAPRAAGVLDEMAVEILLHASGGGSVQGAQAQLRALAGVFGLSLGRAPEGLDRWSEHLEKFSGRVESD